MPNIPFTGRARLASIAGAPKANWGADAIIVSYAYAIAADQNTIKGDANPHQIDVGADNVRATLTISGRGNLTAVAAGTLFPGRVGATSLIITPIDDAKGYKNAATDITVSCGTMRITDISYDYSQEVSPSWTITLVNSGSPQWVTDAG